jgi:sulfatase maturation enzyme AslB (radical SAM superfamily)
MMFESVINSYRKLRENDAFSVLLRPGVVSNYLAFQREIAAMPVIMTSTPPGMEIELTNRCNLACIQCLRSRGLKPYALGDMDFDNYKRILAQFPHLMSLCLNGFGEPLMHKQFFDIVAYTRRERPLCKIGIYSNGMLLDEEKAGRLMDCGVAEVDISLDAAHPDTDHRVRRGGKLAVVHDNIKRLVRIKRETRARFPKVGMNFVMLNENEGELVPFIEHAAEFGVDFVRLGLRQPPLRGQLPARVGCGGGTHGRAGRPLQVVSVQRCQLERPEATFRLQVFLGREPARYLRGRRHAGLLRAFQGNLLLRQYTGAAVQ